MQAANKGKAPLGVIFDCAFGHRADDPLALALLFHADGKNDARILSLSLSTAELNAAAACAALSRFYRQTPERDPFPIGLYLSARLKTETPMAVALTAKRNADGKPAYPHGIQKWHDTADPLPLMRNALASQPDQSLVVVITGPATNAARLLRHPGAKALLAQKAKLLVVAASYTLDEQAAPMEVVLRADGAAAQTLFAEWPTPIVAVTTEAGARIRFPAASIEKDFAWQAGHPVAEAYRAFQPMPYDARTDALAATLFALKPDAEFFSLSGPGTIRAQADGRTTFQPDPTGQHRYLTVAEAKKEELLAAYVQMTSAQLPPLPGRR